MRIFARLKANRGFTLMEMIIVIAVLAILVSISTPAIYKFMQQRDLQAEQNTQAEIVKAMQAYLADKGVLPDDTATGVNFWAQQLAGYTNLSMKDMQTDTWNHDRMYVMKQITTRQIMGTQIPVFYVTLFSKGPNGDAENKAPDGSTITGIALTGKEYSAQATGTAWWRNQTTDDAIVTSFSGISAGGDDVMVRFTDYAAKIDAYNQTLDRLDRLGQALETYARNGYAQKTVACVSTPTDPTCMNGYPEQLIYYPRSSSTGSAGTDTANYYDTSTIVNDSATDDVRRTQMKTLVRSLGLPDDFCCSAVQMGTDGLPKPFYYFSNPRPRASTGAGCGARPTATGTKLPARLTTTLNPDTATNATCG